MMNAKHHKDHKHGRQPDAYELYELEHKPHTLVKAPSDPATPQSRVIDFYDELGIEAQPHLESTNGVIFRFNYYDQTEKSMQPYPQLTRRYDIDKGGCDGDVDCEAEKFILSEHEKFAVSKWMPMMKN